MSTDISHIISQLKARDRTALSKAITLIESANPIHKAQALNLMTDIISIPTNALRIAISGSPGVGKSTFIEAFGSLLTRKGYRPAILTIDPSSTVSGGSILGDRTRMEELAKNPGVFIRQSPSSHFLGGVGRRTREIAKLCEVAGYDIIIIETVGVGQSEIAAEKMVDLFALLILPGSGDELQAIKMGIVEMADMILITKADGKNVKQAEETLRNYKHTLQLLKHKPGKSSREIMAVSALDKTGLEEFLAKVEAYWKSDDFNKIRDGKRTSRDLDWFETIVEELWMDKLKYHPNYSENLNEIKDKIKSGQLNIYEASWETIKKIVD